MPVFFFPEARDRAGAGVVLAGFGVGVAALRVAELGEHPGAEDRSQPGLGQDDLSGRVRPKMGLDLPFQDLDLLVEHGEDSCRTDGRGVGGRDDVGLAEMLGTQSGVDLRGGQPRGRCRVGGLGQQLKGVGRGQVLERLQRGGEVVAQRVPQPLHVTGPLPRSLPDGFLPDLIRTAGLSGTSAGASRPAPGRC